MKLSRKARPSQMLIVLAGVVLSGRPGRRARKKLRRREEWRDVAPQPFFFENPNHDR